MSISGNEVFDSFSNACDRYGEKTAVVGDGAKISFAALMREALGLANALPDTARGRVVGLQVESPIDFMVAYFAIARFGAYLVLVDPRLTDIERSSLLGDLAVDLLLVLDRERQLPNGAVPLETAEGRHFRLWPTEGTVKRNGEARYEPSDFVVHTTSGSSGPPKGIALSGANVLARVASWRDSTSLTSEDTVLCMLTLSHCHGIEILMLPALMTGCTVVAPMPSALTARKLVKLIEQHSVTLISTLPWFYSIMLESVSPARCNLSSIRMLISASAKIERTVAEAFKEKFGIQIRQAYGLSEIGAICLDREGRDDTLVGVPLEGVEVRLMPTGEVADTGELIARGPGLARGYINAPAAQAEMFRDGWLWSQDIVRREPDGFRIIGRRSRFINVGGNKVAPAMIEEALMSYPALREVAVVGFPDPVEGERIVAFVVWHGASDLDGLKTFARTQLAPYCRPLEWVTLQALPRNSIGKVLTSQMQRPVTGETGASG